MIQRKHLRRRWLRLLLGAQLISALVPLADARLETAPEAVVHVEAQGSDDCDPIHVHAYCVLCQHTAQGDAAVATAIPVECPTVPATRGTRPTSDHPAQRIVALEQGRSPPKA